MKVIKKKYQVAVSGYAQATHGRPGPVPSTWLGTSQTSREEAEAEGRKLLAEMKDELVLRAWADHKEGAAQIAADPSKWGIEIQEA